MLPSIARRQLFLCRGVLQRSGRIELPDCMCCGKHEGGSGLFLGALCFGKHSFGLDSCKLS